MTKEFDDLLSLDVTCEMLRGKTACMLLIGEAAAELAGQWADTAPVQRSSGIARVVFGLPVLTLPYPILVKSLMTERNTQLDQLSLFGWIEENAIMEPRAEVLGVTPLAEAPVLFLRDLDLDRPPEAYVRTEQGNWLRVVGVIIARQVDPGTPLMLKGDDGALSALEVLLPADAQRLVRSLRAEASVGQPLYRALRLHRPFTSPEVMSQCDGWWELSRAARFMLAGPAAGNIPFRLDAPRKW
jgi:hypothetical protein